MIGDLLSAQRTMIQRTYERVRRIELKLGIPPSHYEAVEQTPDEQAAPQDDVPSANGQLSELESPEEAAP